jgi:predicted esterase
MSRSPLNSDNFLKAQVPINVPMTYLHLNRGAQKPLLIFFHGYSDNAVGVVRRCFPSLDSRYEILAINGPFPIPVRHGEGWKRAFAWYFADSSKNEVLIHPAVPAGAIENLIAQLNLVDRPKILIGFSQGGFLLPFVLPRLKNVKKLFGIGAAYRSADYSGPLSISVDAFHGEQDDIITLEQSKKSFENFRSLNPQGQYFQFPNLAHTMNDESRALLLSRIEQVLP